MPRLSRRRSLLVGAATFAVVAVAWYALTTLTNVDPARVAVVRTV